jgi:F-type H+-transporting ATPase subunit b
MKRGCMQDRLGWLKIVFMIGLLVSGTEAWAAESAVEWRPIYDLAMRWVNFIILAFVLVKFGRTPLKKFLQNRQADIARQIEELEQEKADVQAEVDQNLKAIDASQERFERMKKRIMRHGERRKKEIIEAGKVESANLIDGAKRKIQNKIHKAEERLRAELIDAAFGIALERLPTLVNAADNERKIEEFYSEIASK